MDSPREHDGPGAAERWAGRYPQLVERAVESLGAGLLITDAAGADQPIVYANAAFEQLTGYGRDEIAGRNCRFLQGPDTDPRAVEEMRSAVRDKRHVRVTLINYRKDGSPFWNEVALSPLRDSDGRVLHYIGFMHDVSAGQAALEGLRVAEERYRRLAENLPGVATYVAEYDGVGRIVYISPQVEAIAGHPRESWYDHPSVWFSALHPDDRERAIDVHRRRFELGEPIDTEYRLLRPDGSEVWLWDKDTVKDDAGSATNIHEGLLVDITAQKRAEADLERSRELHRGVVQALEEGVIVLGSDGEIRSANPSAVRVMGLDPTVTGADVLWSSVERYWEDGRPATRENSVGQGVLASGEPARDVQLHYRRPDGDMRWLSLNYQRVSRPDRPDEPDLVVSFRDITEQRRTLDELRASEERLRTVVRNVPVVLWAIDAEGVITLSEGSGMNAFGEKPSSVVGRSAWEVYAGHRQVTDDLEAALRGNERVDTVDFGSIVRETHMRPLRNPEGEVVGVLGVSVDVTERHRAEQRLSHLALHDSLTGLPNRSLFLDRLEHALARARRESTRCCVLFIDLDRFKRINDSLGHRAGDQLLLASADRIEKALRADDTVSRLGGDEFTVLCEGIRDEEEALSIAEKVGEELGHPYDLGDGELFVTASIGVSLSDDDSTPEGLLRDADAAMYTAKGRGRARTELFDEVSRSHTVNRLALESALHGAVEREEFRLHYQPQYSLVTGAVVGYEALLRWQHPTRGLLAPDDFISVAEDSGLIVPIGRWVVGEATRQAAAWARGRATAPLMSVNLSARQFAQPDVVAMVESAVSAAGADPRALCLEITESVVMEQTHATVAVLGELKALGVRLAIDDFGTGYSSLGYLQRFRLDYLKVDRSFVDGLGRDPEQSAIVDAILKLAQALGLGVVAEGVETREQLESLRALGCELVQGFLFARPEEPGTAGARLDASPLDITG